jgi:signal transduction histidine kinase
MTALNMSADHAPLRRPAAFRMTLGARVTATFAVLFLITGAVLLAVNYVLFAHGLRGWAGASVPPYTASFIAKHDRGLISDPHTPALVVAAARGQLAFVLAHPTEQFFGGGLLPRAGNGFGEPVQSHGYDPALSQLLRQSMLILVPFALLTVALGWLAARRMLRPVRRLTATARQLSAANLGQRLELSGPNDELKELGDTFDQMLARLDAAFESQRRFVANASHELPKASAA